MRKPGKLLFQDGDLGFQVGKLRFQTGLLRCHLRKPRLGLGREGLVPAGCREGDPARPKRDILPGSGKGFLRLLESRNESKDVFRRFFGPRPSMSVSIMACPAPRLA